MSIAEDGTMKVFYNRNLVDKIDEDSKDEWYAFLKELKDFAVEHQLSFDVRDITKSNLTKQDYKNLADTNQISKKKAAPDCFSARPSQSRATTSAKR